jgi:hypothetical protein
VIIITCAFNSSCWQEYNQNGQEEDTPVIYDQAKQQYKILPSRAFSVLVVSYYLFGKFSHSTALVPVLVSSFIVWLAGI